MKKVLALMVCLMFALSVIAVFAADKEQGVRQAGVSQAVFASYLNITVGLVSKWERGEKHPQGPSLKLLTLVQKKGLEAIA